MPREAHVLVQPVVRQRLNTLPTMNVSAAASYCERKIDTSAEDGISDVSSAVMRSNASFLKFNDSVFANSESFGQMATKSVTHVEIYAEQSSRICEIHEAIVEPAGCCYRGEPCVV